MADDFFKTSFYDNVPFPQSVDHFQLVPYDPTHPWEVFNPKRYDKDLNEVRFTVFELDDYIKKTTDAIFSAKLNLNRRSFGKTLEMVGYNKIRGELESLSEKIKAHKRNEVSPDLRLEYAAFRNLVAPLIYFIKQFVLWYAQFAPTPQKRDLYKYSEGTYVRHSIMYFTSDETGKYHAMQNALISGIKHKEFIYGQDTVLHYLNPKNLFRGKNIDTINARLERIKSGITIENFARERDYFYGWYNVEKEGWSREEKQPDGTTKTVKTPPYRPFGAAMDEALKQVEVAFGKSMLFYREVKE